MVEFTKKIKFLYQNMYHDKGYVQLTTALLAVNPTLDNLRLHKASVKKWVNGSVKTSTKFRKNYSDTPLSKLTFKDGTQLFPMKAFDNWTYEHFVRQYEAFQIDQASQHISLEDYQYIYYYHEDIDNLGCFEITNHDNNQIELTTYDHVHLIRYSGKILHHYESNMVHFIVENDLEMMFFSFNHLDLQINFDLYGICLAKDFVRKQPKSSLVVLTHEELSEAKEILFKTKINKCNTTVVDNNRRSEYQSFIHNLSTQLRALKENQNSYFSKDIFLKLFFNEFSLFYNKFDNFFNQFQFQLSSFSSSIKSVFSLLEKAKHRENIRILYTLKDLDKSLFSLVDSEAMQMYAYFIHLSETGQFDIEFIFFLNQNIIIDTQLQKQFEQLQKSGVRLHFKSYSNDLAYTTIAFIESYHLFAIFSLKNDIEFTVTRDAIDVKKLKMEYEVQVNSAVSLSKVLEKQKTLQGRHYFFGYGSKHVLRLTTLDIDGKKVKMRLDDKTYDGEIHYYYNSIFIYSQLGFIKIKAKDRGKSIKIISFISEQEHGDGESIMLFGILSRHKLKEYEVDSIFTSIIDQKESPFDKASFKESSLIHSNVIKPLLYKYEDRK